MKLVFATKHHRLRNLSRVTISAAGRSCSARSGGVIWAGSAATSAGCADGASNCKPKLTDGSAKVVTASYGIGTRSPPRLKSHAHGECMVSSFETAELVLQHDRHLFGVFGEQIFRNNGPRSAGPERNI